ncbi:MAG: glutamate formimidoyltransferase [Chloroflexi bacterium]|nr:glutamate formimidoyltransferase [Chloroflexota bacterium]
MSALVECVPNFSEGRRREVVEDIVATIRSVSGVAVWDVQMDGNHNRSVISFVAPPEAAAEAAFRATRRAAELIDLDTHRGEHPRMGATDVIPLVPIREITMEECVTVARRLGQRIGEELHLPVYLYEEAATREERRDLANVRRGEYEGIRNQIETNPERFPDFGPCKMGKAGAVAVGARSPLIAYNVNLGTNNLGIAKEIAKAIRNSSGGLRYAKALGMALADRGIVQVSINFTNYEKTPIFRTVEMIRREAARYGVPIVSSEVIGLLPQQALVDAAIWYLQLENFDRQSQILEQRLADLPRTAGPDSFVEAVASSTPTPGGGSVAALAGALSAALAEMVCGLTVSKPIYASVSEELGNIREKLRGLRQVLTHLIQEDSDAYENLLRSYRLPQNTEAEKRVRESAIQSAMNRAVEIPLDVARLSIEVLEYLTVVAEKGNKNAASDAGTGSQMAQAAVLAASLNVRTNVATLKDSDMAQNVLAEIETLETRARDLAQKAYATALRRIG